MYVGLEDNYGDKKLYRLDKAREWRTCDLDQVNFIKDENEKVLVEETLIGLR